MMKKPVIQSVDFAEEWIVPRYAIDMYQLLAISLIRLRMFMAYISNICAILDLTKKKEKFYAGIGQIKQATDRSKIFEC